MSIRGRQYEIHRAPHHLRTSANLGRANVRPGGIRAHYCAVLQSPLGEADCPVTSQGRQEAQVFMSKPKTPGLAARLSPSKRPVNNWVVISDTHCGSRLGLLNKCGFTPDQGGPVAPSRLQAIIWEWWLEMWGEWVPTATKGEPFGIILNGDGVDGEPHGCTALISSNPADQQKVALDVLKPLLDLCDGRFKWVRGTEAHVGKSGCSEESAAQALGALPGKDGEFARFELWQKVGAGLVHLLHHVGTTSSSAHEASAVNAEMTAEYVEASRWALRPPDVIVRSHRHRCIEVRLPSKWGFATATVTPGWQLKTPFSYKIAGGRIAPPQFGAILIRQGDRQLFTEPWVKHITRDEPEN